MSDICDDRVQPQHAIRGTQSIEWFAGYFGEVPLFAWLRLIVLKLVRCHAEALRNLPAVPTRHLRANDRFSKITVRLKPVKLQWHPGSFLVDVRVVHVERERPRGRKRKKGWQEEQNDGKPKRDASAIGGIEEVEEEQGDDLTAIHKSRTFLGAISSKKMVFRWCERIQYPVSPEPDGPGDGPAPPGPPGVGAGPGPVPYPVDPVAQHQNSQLWDAFRAGAVWAQSQAGYGYGAPAPGGPAFYGAPPGGYGGGGPPGPVPASAPTGGPPAPAPADREPAKDRGGGGGAVVKEEGAPEGDASANEHVI